MRTAKKALIGLVLAILLVGLSLPMAAEACGCGMVLPHEGSVDVTQEQAIIRWDGQTEDIVMALQAQGNAKEAAWIMPVPGPAQVKLGDPGMFDFLQEFTKPREEYRISLLLDILALGGAPAATPAAAPVTLLARREIGLFDVSILAATDATALTGWLKANGYTFPNAAAKVLQHYVDQGWYYVAARISPGKTSEVHGELDPLWITFRSNQLVYPMRTTALARRPEAVILYILADHRMDVPELHTSFAGWISPSDLPAEENPSQQVVDRKYFLTKLQTVIQVPETWAEQDYFASYIPDDEYRDVEVVYQQVSCFALCGALLALLLVVWFAVLVRRSRKGRAQKGAS